MKKAIIATVAIVAVVGIATIGVVVYRSKNEQ